MKGSIGVGTSSVDYEVDGVRYTTAYTVDDMAKEKYTIDSILAGQEQMNRIISENSRVFSGYSSVVSQDTMDTNTIRANSEIFSKKSKKKNKI